MFAWLGSALLGMYVQRTKLFGLRTTIFVRRMLLVWIPLAAFTTLSRPDFGALTMAHRIVGILPVAFAFMYVFGFGVVLVFRGIGLVMPIPFAFFVWIADLFWRLEAGSEAARAQAKESARDLAQAERTQQRGWFHEQLARGEVGVELGSVTVGSDAYHDLRVENGQVIGRRDGKEHVIGAASRPMMGEGIELRIGDRMVARLDEDGRNEDGEVVLHPRDQGPERWKERVGAPLPAMPTALWRFGPLLHSAGLGLLCAAAWGGFGLIPDAETTDGLAFLPDETAPPPPSVGEDPSEAPSPAAAEAARPADPEAAPRGPAVPLEPAQTTASRFLTEGRVAHEASRAFDGNPGTTWAVRDAVLGEDWLEATFATPVRVERVFIGTGYDHRSRRGTDLFVANAHLARVAIETDAGRSTHEVGPEARSIEVPLGGVETRRVRLVVEAVHPGERWQDTCVNEVRVYGQP